MIAEADRVGFDTPSHAQSQTRLLPVQVVRIESSWEGRKLPPALTEGSDYASDLFKGTYRTDIKPINIEQPEGPSFTVRANVMHSRLHDMLSY